MRTLAKFLALCLPVALLAGCASQPLAPSIPRALPMELMKACPKLPDTKEPMSIEDWEAWSAKVAPDYADCAVRVNKLIEYIKDAK